MHCDVHPYYRSNLLPARRTKLLLPWYRDQMAHVNVTATLNFNFNNIKDPVSMYCCYKCHVLVEELCSYKKVKLCLFSSLY